MNAADRHSHPCASKLREQHWSGWQTARSNFKLPSIDRFLDVRTGVWRARGMAQ
jgi:hypothetical protein